jgi:hypothetical protein
VSVEDRAKKTIEDVAAREYARTKDRDHVRDEAMKRHGRAKHFGEYHIRAPELAEQLGCSVKQATRIMKRHPDVLYLPQREGATGQRPRPILPMSAAEDLYIRMKRGERL